MTVTALAPLLRHLHVTHDPAAQTLTRADGQVIPIDPDSDPGSLTLQVSGKRLTLVRGGPSSPEHPDPTGTVDLSGLNALSVRGAFTDLNLHLRGAHLDTARGPIPLRRLDGPSHTTEIRLDGRWQLLMRGGLEVNLQTLLRALESPQRWVTRHVGPVHVIMSSDEVLVNGTVLTPDQARTLGTLLSAT